MLLIAVLGDVGAGKTSLLARLGQWWRDQGKEPDGFLALAGDRDATHPGAARYDLLMLRLSERLPYVVRDPSLNPPYKFDDGTASTLRMWADELSAHASPSLVILDEFGPREAAGGGHVSLWPRVAAAKPDIVVIAVRKGMENVIVSLLGVRFHMLIDVALSDAWETLREACVEHSDWMRVGLYGGGSGGFEASDGAVLHGAQIPLRGLGMSSMQSVIMTYAADGMGKRSRVAWVAVIAAALKALSPAGSRARPMIAITAQGFLYAMAITLLGWNIVGVAVGGFLIGVWAAIQGVVLQYLFVGNALVQAYDAVIHWILQRLNVHAIGFLQIIAAWTAVCGALTSAVTVLAWKHRHRMPGRLRDLVFRKPARITVEWTSPGIVGAMRRGLKDISRPLFWLPVIIVIAVLLAMGSSVESVVWIVIRAAAVGFVLFALVRSFDLRRFIGWLQERGHWGPALAFRRAVERIGGDGKD